MFSTSVVESLSRKLKAIRCWFNIHDWEPRCMGMKRCIDCKRSKSK